MGYSYQRTYPLQLVVGEREYPRLTPHLLGKLDTFAALMLGIVLAVLTMQLQVVTRSTLEFLVAP